MKPIEIKPIKAFSFKEALENLDVIVKELEQLIAEARESETGENGNENFTNDNRIVQLEKELSHLSSASNPATQDHETGSSKKE